MNAVKWTRWGLAVLMMVELLLAFVAVDAVGARRELNEAVAAAKEPHWEDVADWPAPPEACLVNWYEAGTKLGLHVDADEDAKDAPVVSVSLGSRALVRLGGLERKGPTSSMRLASGDVVVLGGKSRRAYHGVDRIWPDSSTLIPGGGRINLTLRRVRAV